MTDDKGLMEATIKRALKIGEGLEFLRESPEDRELKLWIETLDDKPYYIDGQAIPPIRSEKGGSTCKANNTKRKP